MILRTSRAGIVPAALASFLTISPINHAASQNSLEREGLVKLEDVRVGVAYARPGVDWKKFKSIYLMPLNVPDEVRDAAPDNAKTRLGESYVLREDDVKALKDDFNTTMRDVIVRDGRYPVVDAPRDDTLIVETQLVNMTMSAPLELSRSTGSSPGMTLSRGGGYITIVAAFADGATGTVIARLADQKVAPDIWRQNTRVSNMATLKRMYSAWAKALCNKLADIQTGRSAMPGGLPQ